MDDAGLVAAPRRSLSGLCRVRTLNALLPAHTAVENPPQFVFVPQATTLFIDSLHAVF